LLHEVRHEERFAQMLLMIFEIFLSALSALEHTRLALDNDLSRIEERIPAEVWIGMMDAFFRPHVDLCCLEPCLYLIIPYQGPIDSR
jgi:hypothetical protein